MQPKHLSRIALALFMVGMSVAQAQVRPGGPRPPQPGNPPPPRPQPPPRPPQPAPPPHRPPQPLPPPTPGPVRPIPPPGPVRPLPPPVVPGPVRPIPPPDYYPPYPGPIRPVPPPDYRPPRPGPIRPLPPPYRPNPYPVRPVPLPPRPLPPPRPPAPYPDPDYEMRRTVFVERWLTDENVNLSTYFESYLSDYEVESVIVELSRSSWDSRIDLVSDNGSIEDTEYNPQDRVVLAPRTYSRASLMYLNLAVSGQIYVDSITVVLYRRGGYNPPPPPPHYGNVRVDLNVNTYLSPGDRLDLERHFNSYAYSGYRIEAVEISGRANRYGASVDLWVNGQTVGSVTFDDYVRYLTIYPWGNTTIGYGVNNLMLTASDYVSINQVTLILVR